jgi:hypothetical protein
MSAMKSNFLSAVVTMLVICMPTTLWADHSPSPATVTIVGNLQDELGCPGDWQPDCASTYLAFDADDTVWQGVFNVPAGSWEYKAALNDSWNENYGANAQLNGANISINLGVATDVKFYYSHETHWITDNVNSVIATAPGSFQSELGCPGDWQPECLRSWLQDPDGDGVYEFSTDAIPGGSYEFKVALDESWTTSYPAANVPFTSNTGDTVTISYDAATNDVSVTVTPPGPTGETDGDGVPDESDICPGFDDNVDTDSDTVPDGCDTCPLDQLNDADGDGVCGDVDICVGDDTVDTDTDSVPDDCDVCPVDAENDADGDGFCESADNCPLVANADQSNNDGDNDGDACDIDDDNDGIDDDTDNCPLVANADQSDHDSDGAGDVCDMDIDGDNVLDNIDNCPYTMGAVVVDDTGCSIDQYCACENSWKNHGAYVRCIARTANNFISQGLIDQTEHGAITSEVGNSSCGAKK